MATEGQLLVPEYLMTINRFPGDGVTEVFGINFAGGYISQSHIKGYVMDAATREVTREFTPAPGDWVGPNQIRVLPVVKADEILVLYRDTPKGTPLVDFVDGAILNEANLDTNSKQAVFVSAEMTDRFGVTAETASTAAEVATEARDAAVTAEAAATTLATRAIRAPLAEVLTETLPSRGVRAGKFIAFDDDGEPTVGVPTSDSATALANALAQPEGALLVGDAVARVDNIAALRALAPPARKTVVRVDGYYAPGDGINPSFLWVPASTKTDDGITVIAPNAGTPNGRWERGAFGLHIRECGARCDGITDDSAAIQRFLDSDVPEVDFTGAECRVATKLTALKPKRLLGKESGGRLLYDINRGRCLEIDTDDFVMDGVSVTSLNKAAPRSVDKGMVYVKRGCQRISIMRGEHGWFEQKLGDGAGYFLYVEGEAVDSLNIVFNHFEHAYAEDDGLDAAEGMCGFFYSEVPTSQPDFTRGVRGLIGWNTFKDTASLPVSGVLRSDADAIRFFNGWTAGTDDYNSPEKTNSYEIDIVGNTFIQIQHLSIKASGVGGLHVYGNRLDNTQADRYPDVPNPFGRNGEKDWQVGFEFRGGNVKCHDNIITSSAGCIVVNGVIGKPGYRSQVYGNTLTLMDGARTESSCLSTNMDNCEAWGNTIRAPGPEYTRALDIAFRPVYHPEATALRGLNVRDNNVVSGGIRLLDLDDCVIDAVTLDGPIEFRRVNNSKIRRLGATMAGVPWVLGGTGASSNNQFGEIVLRSTGLTAGTGRRLLDLTSAFTNSTVDVVRVICDDSPTGPGSGNYMFSVAGNGMRFGRVDLEYRGANGSFFTRYASLDGVGSIERLHVDVANETDNLTVPLAIIGANADRYVLETVMSRLVTGNIDNRGTVTRIARLIGGFGVTNNSGGTSTVYETIPV